MGVRCRYCEVFDNIDHSRLLKEVRLHIDNPGFLCLIKSWISVGVQTQEGLILPQKGIPQGAVISPILANIYLHEFDELVSATDLKLVRYADDFLVLSHSQERILSAKLEIINLLDSMGLTINTEKTQVTNFERGFRFLGHGFLENAIFPIDANKVKLKSGIEEKQEKNKLKIIVKKSPEKPLSYKEKGLETLPLLQDKQVDDLGEEKDGDTKNIAYLHQPFLAEVETEILQESEEGNSSFQKNIWNREMAAIYLIEQGTSIYKDYQQCVEFYHCGRAFSIYWQFPLW